MREIILTFEIRDCSESARKKFPFCYSAPITSNEKLRSPLSSVVGTFFFVAKVEQAVLVISESPTFTVAKNCARFLRVGRGCGGENDEMRTAVLSLMNIQWGLLLGLVEGKGVSLVMQLAAHGHTFHQRCQ